MDLQKPPTEIEVAKLNDQLTPAGKDILRRLAFQRDTMKDILTALVRKLQEVHDNEQYQGVWTSYHIHGGEYDGPNYQREFKAVVNLLEKEKS